MVLEQLTGITYAVGIDTILPLIGYVSAVVLYSIFIFKLYRFVSRKDIFRLNLREYASGKDAFANFFKVLFYVLEYLVILPIFIVVWFMVFSGFLIVLAKNHTAETIILVSMTVVSSIRITSYYNEDLSKDLAKMLPFALLGIALVDVSFLNLGNSLAIVKELPNHVGTVAYYLVFTICLELLLRIMSSIVPKRDPKNEE